MSLVIAWLAQGKVRVKEGGAPPRTLDSPYANDLHARSVRAQQRHAWKSQGTGFLAGGTLWGRPPGEGPAPAVITSITAGSTPGQVVYSLASGSLCALLSADRLGEEERRLWNHNSHQISFLHACPRTGSLAFSVIHQNATANLGVMIAGETGFMEITEGDSVDTAPRWVPGEGSRLVFQSAGVGRDRHGNFIALGPFSVQQVDVDSLVMETLAEDPRQDFVAPRLDAGGALYCIRRPYDEHRKVEPLRVLKDFFLLPFRLLFAVFQFFNVFTRMFTGKSLTTAGGPRQELDVKRMMIWGNVVAGQRATPEDETPDLVPSSWQLVRRRAGREEEVLAKGVLAYDIAPDGTIVYSNGSAIFVRSPDGRTERIVKEAMIEQVAVVGR
jgi:hypothetical protein